MKPITIKAASILSTLEAARELVLAIDDYRFRYCAESVTNMWEAQSKLATLLGLERDAKTGRYVR